MSLGIPCIISRKIPEVFFGKFSGVFSEEVSVTISSAIPAIITQGFSGVVPIRVLGVYSEDIAGSIHG